MSVAHIAEPSPLPFDRNSGLSVENGSLSVTKPCGERIILHPLWLRERLPDARVMDTLTGQRLIEAADLPLNLAITSISHDHIVRFSDGFETHLSANWIDNLLSPAPITERVLWDGAQTLPTAYNFTEIATHHTHNALHNPPLRAFLDQMHTHGFAIVRGVPTDKDGALEFATMIGPIRRTNWGGLADVKAIANAYDLTMTPRHLEPHSDNPYREPVPGYILLHCLINDAEGGDSTLVDGYRAAQHLREKDAEAFETLTTTVVQFRYRDATALLENKAPLISLDEKENIIQVRYSNRTELIDRLPPEHLNRYYRARQMLWHLIRPQSSLTLRFKLSPGDLLMMDNYRLYHGRSGYTLSTGSRHMRQCYMDRDTVASKRDILHRIHS